MSSIYSIIKRPLLSEKQTSMAEVANVYAFEVLRTARKDQIKEAIERLFNVKVKKVRTMVTHGERKRMGRHIVKVQNWKKALVELEKGQKIEII